MKKYLLIAAVLGFVFALSCEEENGEGNGNGIEKYKEKETEWCNSFTAIILLFSYSWDFCQENILISSYS